MNAVGKLTVYAILAIATLATGATPEAPAIPYRQIGQIQPRNTSEIVSSNWSIGAETMDRDYTIYRNWREYLAPLGIKRARIQSGWAKTEKVRGVYDWAWMDEIVLDMVEQSVRPWVCLCYGNHLYPGGGGADLGNGMITSPEAMAAWKAYVSAYVTRYGKYIHEWEIWNEPRGGINGVPPYANLVVQTAETIRALQPQAVIYIASGSSFEVDYAKALLENLKRRRKLHLVSAMTYHPYSANPDLGYHRVGELRKVIAAYSKSIGIFQGENGAPSVESNRFALSHQPWSEKTQAKWYARRMLGDLGGDIPSSCFAIIDMKYADGWNHKGLLKSADDQTVERPKQAYYAVQNVTAIFDNTLTRVRNLGIKLSPNNRVSAFAFTKPDGAAIVAIWSGVDKPKDEDTFLVTTVQLSGLTLKEPVYVDLRTGGVYEVPAGSFQRTGGAITFKQIPIYDSVILLADKSALGELAPVDAELASLGKSNTVISE